MKDLLGGNNNVSRWISGHWSQMSVDGDFRFVLNLFFYFDMILIFIFNLIMLL